MNAPQSKFRHRLRDTWLIVWGGLVGIGFGFVAEAQPNEDRLAKALSMARASISAHYVEPVSPEKLQANLLKGLIGGLDPHSEYLTPAEVAEQKERLNSTYAGIGVTNDAQACIVKVFPGSPAELAGLQARDCITAIDGRPTVDADEDEIVARVRGKPGTLVFLQLQRDGKPIERAVLRAEIHAPTVESRLLKVADRQNVAVIKIDNFYASTMDEVGKALDAALKDHLTVAILLDLRDNPGGLIRSAVGVASYFLPESATVVSLRGKDDSDNRVYRATKEDWQLADACDETDWVAYLRGRHPQLANLPVAVLVNQFSASASEVLVAALREHGRARIVGSQTFGKGSVQTMLSLGEYGAARLTTARYYTPQEHSIQAVGIKPDVFVADAKVAAREADVPNHLANEAGLHFGRKEALAQQRSQAKGAIPVASSAIDLHVQAALADLGVNSRH